MIFKLKSQVCEAADVLGPKLKGHKPEIAIVLGSGFAEVIRDMKAKTEVPYREIPHFPNTTVKGHTGLFSVGEIGGREVLIMQGRLHHYEGHDMRAMALPIRLMQAVGVKTLVLTNAAGSINSDYNPGDLMIIADHINLSLRNPLAASDASLFGPRFVDTSKTYDETLRSIARTEAKNFPLTVREGVYTYTTGPSYETPAEIRMMRILGGDAVGMSTFQEALVAHHGGMRVFGLSMISNYGSGISSNQLSHHEIMDTMSGIRSDVANYLSAIIEKF